MKLFKILKLLFNCKLSFSKIKEKKVILFDCENIKSLKKLFKKKDYYILTTRYNNFKIIYLNNNIILELIKNYNFNQSIKINYLIAVIKSFNPRLILTHIDNSRDFHILSKFFYKKIYCAAIQMANRGDLLYNPLSWTKKFFIPNFFCFSNYEKKLYKKRKAIIKNYYPIGSLTSAFAKKYLDLDKNKKSLNYDICLISQPFIGKEFPQVKNFSDTEGLIAKYTHKLCKEENLKLVFIGKRKKNTFSGNQEIEFYNKYLGKNNFKILQPKIDNYLSYRKLYQSKIIIGHNSSLLREAIGFKKKVLVCNFTGSKLIQFPAKGIIELKSTNYDDFKKRVLKIINMKKSDYFKQINRNQDYIILPPGKTLKLLLPEIRHVV